MKEKFFNLKTITLIVLGVLLVFPTIAQNRVLVSGTDFEPLPGKEVESWIAISDVTTKGVLTPSITINASQPGDKGTKTDIGYDKNASGKVTSSHFQSNKDLYAITKNPIILDSLDFIDDPTNKWGIVFNTQSQSAAGSNKGIINISLKGLKPLSGLEVKIEWRTVVAKTAQSTALKDCGNGVEEQKLEFHVMVIVIIDTQELLLIKLVCQMKM